MYTIGFIGCLLFKFKFNISNFPFFLLFIFFNFNGYIVEKIAAIKDMLEIDSLKTAIEITDTVFTQIIPELKIGAVEKEISSETLDQLKVFL